MILLAFFLLVASAQQLWGWDGAAFSAAVFFCLRFLSVEASTLVTTAIIRLILVFEDREPEGERGRWN